MRQSEYTQYYERRGYVKYPVRGKLYMRHRGRAIYVSDRGLLTDGLSGMRMPLPAGDKQVLRQFIDDEWDVMQSLVKDQPRVWWRSKAGGVITINGRQVYPSTKVRSIPY